MYELIHESMFKNYIKRLKVIVALFTVKLSKSSYVFIIRNMFLSLSEPRPSIIQRGYIFEFNCPNSEFDAGDLKECISNARLCPTDDIKLCDRPFKRIQGVTASNRLMNITMKMEGTLPYDMIYIEFTQF